VVCTYTGSKKKFDSALRATSLRPFPKLGAIATISAIFDLFATATAIAKYIKNCFGEEQENSIEWIASFFDSSPIIFAIFLKFQTSEHLAENSKHDWRDRASLYINLSTINIGVHPTE
jgi:hypothetical protein